MLCQAIEKKNAGGKLVAENLDKRRTASQTAYGLAFIGPLSHYWYEWLDAAALKLIPAGKGPAFIGGKVVADLSVFGPIHLAAFLLWTGVMVSGQSFSEASASLRKEFVTAITADTMFWAPVQTSNFSLVPVKYQALCTNAACVIDAAFLSYVGNHPGALREKLLSWFPRKSEDEPAAQHVN